MKKRTILFFILTVLWMGIVFLFSAETASESKQTSLAFLNKLIDFFDIDIVNKEVVEDLVRSLAHFALYLCGGMFAYSLFLMVLPRFKFVACLGFGLIYSLSDEIHQVFVPGRAFEFKDIVIDFSGFLLGACVVAIVHKLWVMIKNVQNARKI